MKLEKSASFTQDRIGTADSEHWRFATVERALSAVATTCLVGLVFYVYSRGFVSLSQDEFTKAVIAWNGLHNPIIWLNDAWLPGHFPLIAFTYLIVGDLLTASRLVSLLFGIVAVLGIYRLSHQIGIGWIGCISTALCATHPLVVWLSATGLVDILYAAPFVLGLSYYLQPQRPGEVLPFYIACVLFAVSCVFHYNAWLAVAIIVISISYDLLRGRGYTRLHQFLGLCAVGTVPVAWFVWNWLQYSDPLYFWRMLSGVGTAVLKTWGYHPSLKNAVSEIVQLVLNFGPILSVLAVASAAGIIIKGRKYRNGLFLWFFLLTFGIGLIFLYTSGGHPTAYPDRYVLIPSLIVAVLAAQALSSLLMNQDQYVRVFAGLLLSVTIMVNLWVTRQISPPHERIQEAMAIAEYFKNAKNVGLLQAGDRILLESKPWNEAVIGVLLNNPGIIIKERTSDSHEGQGSVLMSSEEEARRLALERGVRYIAVWSDKVRDHVKRWNLQPIGHVKSYTIYELK